jgi:hypothetical protein
MSAFYDLIDEYLGDDDALSDIRIMVRRLWFYDFNGYPLRLWQGKGRLFTEDGNVWLGTIDANDRDLHQTPAIQDGRDGSSATYTLGMTLFDLPGQPAGALYEAIKAQQWRVTKRNVTCYMVVVKEGEALRPMTPIAYFQQLVMLSSKFSEVLEADNDGKIITKYKINVTAKDNNFGRSNVPGGTYADTIQKQRAKELGVTDDRGCEFLALLANRTYQIP